MTILAIDPGPVESAWVKWNGEMILGRGKCDNAVLLDAARKSFRDAEGDMAAPSMCAIEMIASYGMAVGAEVFETCVLIGRLVEAFGEHRTVRVKRLEVKQHLCHDSRAKDGNIRQALIDRFGAPGTKKVPGGTYGLSGDTWQAFALAVTWFDRHGAARESVAI